MSKFVEARETFESVAKRTGFAVEVSYNIALCCYQVKDYPGALRHLAEVIESGIQEYPELNVGVCPEDILSVGNTPALYKSHLVEAFNLKAAIEYSLRNSTCLLMCEH